MPLSYPDKFSVTKVEAPATSANFGPGFDVFAVALNSHRDALTVTTADREGITVEVSGLGSDAIPRDPMTNAAGAVAREILRTHGLRERLKIEVRKGIPTGVGLGSSAASSAAAALAIGAHFGLELTAPELIEYASVGELVCSGVAHRDNVSAAILGGFVLSGISPGQEPVSLRMRPNHAICIVTPQIDLPERKTAFLRSLLPRVVRLEEMVQSVGSAALVVAGLSLQRVDLIGAGMSNGFVDRIRGALIDGFEDVKASALAAGASGVCISGAGPSVLALVDSGRFSPQAVIRKMTDAFGSNDVPASGFVTNAGEGARIVGHE